MYTTPVSLHKAPHKQQGTQIGRERCLEGMSETSRRIRSLYLHRLRFVNLG